MKNRKIFIIIVSVVAIALVFAIARLAVIGRGSVREVDTAKAVKKDLVQSITVTGNIEANNKEDIMLSSMQKVTDVPVSEGQQVKAGDIIARVDTTDLSYQLQKAQTSYEVTKLNLDTAQSNLNNVINVKSSSSRKALENAVQQAQINLDNIKRKYTEAQNKPDQSNTPTQGYDNPANSTADLENQVKLAEIQLDNAKRNLSDYSVDSKTQINQQRSQVEQLKKQLASARADIDNVKSKLINNEIKASIDGTIVKLGIKPNQYPTQENNIISIYDLSKYKVLVSVSQYDAIQISEGQRAAVKIKGLDKAYEGTVTSIGEAAEVSFTGTNKEAKVKVEVALSNPDDKIKAGYEADVDILLKETKDAIAISFEAIKEDKDGKAFIYIIQNNRASKRYVKTGTETEFDIQVLEGLKENEVYIKNPPAALKEGDRVRVTGGK